MWGEGGLFIVCAFCAMRNLICICFPSENRAKRLLIEDPLLLGARLVCSAWHNANLPRPFLPWIPYYVHVCVCVFCVYFLYFTCSLSFSYSMVFIKFRLATCLPAVFLFLMRLSRFPFGLVWSGLVWCAPGLVFKKMPWGKGFAKICYSLECKKLSWFSPERSLFWGRGGAALNLCLAGYNVGQGRKVRWSRVRDKT